MRPGGPEVHGCRPQMHPAADARGGAGPTELTRACRNGGELPGGGSNTAEMMPGLSNKQVEPLVALKRLRRPR